MDRLAVVISGFLNSIEVPMNLLQSILKTAMLTALGLSSMLCGLHAQLATQTTPFTTQIDLSSLLAGRGQTSLPLWIENLSHHKYRDDTTGLHRTAVRVRLRKLSSLTSHVEFRVGMEAGLEKPAVITGWNETGQQLFASDPIGSAASRITEVVRIPINGMDYVELDLPKDGSRLTSLLATILKKSQVLHPVDFPPAAVSDPFGNPATVSSAQDQDKRLWTRVSAMLESESFRLLPTGSQPLQFTLAKPPRYAMVCFEMRNVSPELPPSIGVNGTPLPAVSMTMPDLADPGWSLRNLEVSKVEHLYYSGWIRLQQAIPAGALANGENELLFFSPSQAEPAEIRRVEIQLKY
jgi:hypothetical protein